MLDVGLEGLAPARPDEVRTTVALRSIARPSRRVPVPTPVFLAALACAAIATTWSVLTHSVLLYDDAQSHLNIARHVTDGLRPGLVQLGTVWLPLPHILLAPLVSIDWLWHSGAAGAIVGGCCFVYSAVRIHTLVDELTGSRVGAWCAFAVYAVNFNLLYLQSTALTEPVLLAFLVGAAFHLARWLKTLSVRELVIAGTFTFCATLTRYDGWALLAAATAVVAGWSWLQTRDSKQTEANLVTFGVIAGYGVVLWMTFNLLIFHNPLEFMQSAYSAQSQQSGLAQLGALETKGHLLTAALTYGWTVVDVLGPPVALAGAICIGGLALTRWSGRRRALVILGVLGAPVAFNVISLWTGQTVVRVPQVSPHGLWNDRYGLMALPLAAVALGVAAARSRRLAPLIAAVPAVGMAWMAAGTPITLRDGRVGDSSATHSRPLLAAPYVHRNYRGGEILADDSKASPFMFETGLDLKSFVTIGFEPWYRNAVRTPASTVAWVVSIDGDAVSADISAHPGRFRDFRLVLTDSRPNLLIRIYRREGAIGA